MAIYLQDIAPTFPIIKLANSYNFIVNQIKLVSCNIPFTEGQLLQILNSYDFIPTYIHVLTCHKTQVCELNQNPSWLNCSLVKGKSNKIKKNLLVSVGRAMGLIFLQVFRLTWSPSNKLSGYTAGYHQYNPYPESPRPYNQGHQSCKYYNNPRPCSQVPYPQLCHLYVVGTN